MEKSFQGEQDISKIYKNYTKIDRSISFSVGIVVLDSGMTSSEAGEDTIMWRLNYSEGSFLPMPKVKDWERYNQQVAESGGFDVDCFPDPVLSFKRIITPVKDPQRYVHHLVTAIGRLNQRKKSEGGISIDFVRIIKLNSLYVLAVAMPQPTTCLYYTFEARDVPDGPTRTYHGQVDLVQGKDSDHFIIFRERASSDTCEAGSIRYGVHDVICPPPIKVKDWERYNQQVAESDGFDVDCFPGMMGISLLIQPVDLEPGLQGYLTYLLTAIDRLNQAQEFRGGTPLEFVRILKLNTRYRCFASIYYTFEARDVPDGPPIAYQGRVDLVPGQHHTVFSLIRVKPSSDV